MPADRRRRSRSRSRRKPVRQRSSSASPAKAKKGKDKPKSKDDRGERDTAAKKAAASRSAAANAEEEESSEEGGGKFAWEEDNAGAKAEAGGLSLEAKVALLEVENETLKAENAALKKRLVEALRGGGGAAQRAAAVAAKPGQPPPAPERPAAPAAASDDPRRARLAAAAAEASSDRAQARRREREEGVEPKRGAAAADEDDQAGDVPMHPNAVMLLNGAMEAYNEAVPNNIPLEKRLPLVQEKLDPFLGAFDNKIQILDLKSGKPVIKDFKTFTSRYSCVFRESGSKLKGTVHKRFYYDASGGKPTYCLDFETHESLVTATPGTPQDGKLGVRDPRTEHLIVLYEEKGGKLVRMWIRPDTEKLGLDPTAGEDVLVRTDALKAFQAKVAECKGGEAGEFIFHNYHDTPTVG